MSFIHDNFLLETKTAAAAVSHVRGASADHRLSLPSSAERRRRRSPVRQSVRNLARRRPLQMARDARERRARTVLHGRRRAARQIPGVGEDRAPDAAQSALSLDAPRAEAVLRHRRAAGRENGRQRVGARERGADSRRSSARRAFSASSASRRSARPTIRRIR